MIKQKSFRKSKTERFNSNHLESNFLKNYQEIMIQRLYLNKIGKYDPEEVKKIVSSVYGGGKLKCDTKIKNGIQLTCNIEPELYILIQETAKKITGDLIEMDELIHLLLSYFTYAYNFSTKPKRIMPFKHAYKRRRLIKLILFQNRFEKYYKNISKSIKTY